MGNCQTTHKLAQRSNYCPSRKSAAQDDCLEIKFLTTNEHSGFLLTNSPNAPPTIIYAIDDPLDDQSTSTSAPAVEGVPDHCEEYDLDSPKSTQNDDKAVSIQSLEPPVMMNSKCRRSAASSLHHRYKGETHQGKACGYGIFEDENGSRYEGFWKDNKAHGTGRYTRQDGSWYCGNWEDNMQSGQGEEHWPDGSSYEGTYVRGLKTGRGKFTWADGSFYSGELKDNLADGFGEHYWAGEGRRYQGDWERNRMHGWGRMEWADGSMFDGEFKDDKRHGYGRFVWPSGVSFVGFWEDGLQHGRGVMIDADGRRKRGLWEKGVNIKWEPEEAVKEGIKFAISPKKDSGEDDESVASEKAPPPKTQDFSGSNEAAITAPSSTITVTSRGSRCSRRGEAMSKSTSHKSSGTSAGLGHFRSISADDESINSALMADLLKSPAFSHLDSEFEQL